MTISVVVYLYGNINTVLYTGFYSNLVTLKVAGCFKGERLLRSDIKLK